MVLVMSRAFNTAAGGDFEIEFAVKPRSLAIAYALGVLLTLAVVAVSAWRVSTMTISAAIRNPPEPRPAPAAQARPGSGRASWAGCSPCPGSRATRPRPR